MADDKKKEKVSSRADQPAQVLLDYMDVRVSGTPQKTVDLAAAYAKEHPQATAGELFDHMVSIGVYASTLQKLGEWLFGAGWVLRANETKDVQEEMVNLRRQLAQKNETIALQAARIEGLEAQLQLISDDKAYLERRVAVANRRDLVERLAEKDWQDVPREGIKVVGSQPPA